MNAFYRLAFAAGGGGGDSESPDEISLLANAPLGITDAQKAAFEKELALMTDLVNQSRISDETALLLDLDKRRDDLVVYLTTTVSQMRKSPIEAQRAAAQTVYNIIKPYIGIYKSANQQETAQIQGLLLDLDKEGVPALIQTLGLKEIQDSLRAANDEYAKLTAQRTGNRAASIKEAQEQAQPLEDLQAAQRELQSLKSRIRGLGTVNVAAIAEYEEVSARYQFLSEQMQDAETAKRELEDLITSLTEEMQRIFSESFSIINRNFQEIFRDLFGGGEARLELTDPENVLESGIEIKVAPPGKVIKNLISLSGGEQSFVAIAIYFAILRLRPSPFCILDEIDAALDEGNVRRYAQYLQNFTDTTQFILVTHRRSAMEEASVLYGVTMQEDGISRLLRMEQEELQ